MIRSAVRFTLALTVLAVAAVPSQAQDVAGKWIFTMEGPQGQVEVAFNFDQSGSEVGGSVDMSAIPEVESAEISDGLYEDGILSFLMHLGAQGQVFTMEMEADVDGDEMVGEAYMAEMGQGMPFVGKRADG